MKISIYSQVANKALVSHKIRRATRFVKHCTVWFTQTTLEHRGGGQTDGEHTNIHKANHKNQACEKFTPHKPVYQNKKDVRHQYLIGNHCSLVPILFFLIYNTNYKLIQIRNRKELSKIHFAFNPEKPKLIGNFIKTLIIN